MIGRAYRGLDRRLRITSFTRTAMTKVFPDHWSFMLGEIAVYSFMVLVATGVFLSLFFDADSAKRPYLGGYAPMHGEHVSSAYASTVELSWDVKAGLLMRQTHHWAALIFVAAIIVHLCRIFFTGAFRKPRDVNWLVGVTLLLLSIGNGFLGYSLPDDLLSGTGLRIANAIMLSIPVIGAWLSFGFFGGEFPGRVVEHMYPLHILVVPGLIAALIGVHMVILIRQKHTHFAGPGRTDRTVVGSTMWPTYAFRSLSLLCAVAAVTFLLGGLVQINPVWSWGPFEPGLATSPAQPDWYVGWLDGALRLWPPVNQHIAGHLVPAVFLPGVLLPGLTFLGLYAWPWLERLVTRDRAAHHVTQRPREAPARLAVGVAALTFYGVLLLAGGYDLAARLLQVPTVVLLWTLRIAALVLPVLAGAIAWRLARALRASDAPHLVDLPAEQLRPHRDRDPAEPSPRGRSRPRRASEVPDAAALRWHPDLDAGDAPEPTVDETVDGAVDRGRRATPR